MTVQAVRALVEPTRLVALPPITEEDARRTLVNARRAHLRAVNKLLETPSGYSIWTRQGPSLEWLAAEQKVTRAERRLTAAVRSLDAVLSQKPDRSMGSWAA